MQKRKEREHEELQIFSFVGNFFIIIIDISIDNVTSATFLYWSINKVYKLCFKELKPLKCTLFTFS